MGASRKRRWWLKVLLGVLVTGTLAVLVLGALFVWFFFATTPTRPQLTEAQIDTLVRECRSLSGSPELFADGYFADMQNLPPFIASLKPQYVVMNNDSRGECFDIRLTTGFTHTGFVIALDAEGDSLPVLLPSKGRRWEVASDVFYYRVTR